MRALRPFAAAARRLERHRTLLGLLVAAVGIFLAYVGWVSVNGVPFQDRYEISAVVPRDAPILKQGDGVRIAGRLAGLVTDVEPYHHNVRVEMELEPGFAPVGRDARAAVRVKSIVYLTYLELDPGDLDQPLPEGGTIPLRHSGSKTDLLEVVQLFHKRVRDELSGVARDTGLGVAGRGTELNAALADLPAATREGAAELRALTRTPGAIARSLQGAGGIAAGLRGRRPDDVAGLIVAGDGVLSVVAARSEALGRAVELLAPVERRLIATGPSATRLLRGVHGLARDLTPAVADLARALPDLNRVLGSGAELSAQAARLRTTMDPVLARAPPVLRALRPTVASIGPLTGPLDALVSKVLPYGADIRRGSEQLISATTTRYPNGTAPGSSALRFAPIFTCHRPRQPYPAPGETLTHSQSC